MTMQVRLQRPTPAQAAIHADKHRYRVLKCGRRFGKSTTIAQEAADVTLRQRLPFGLFAPKYKLLTEVWRDLKLTFEQVTTRSSDTDMRIELVTGAVIEGWTLEDPDAGRSRKYGGIVIDEAGLQRDLRKRWVEAIRPTLTDYSGTAMFAGTPKGLDPDGFLWFWNRCSVERDWSGHSYSTYDNPHLLAAEVAEMELELGDLAAEQEIWAKFVDLSTAERFLPDPTLWDRLVVQQPPPLKQEPLVLALDAGVSHDCFAAVAVGRDPEDADKPMERWTRVWVPDGDPLDFNAIEREVWEFIDDYNVVQMTYDPYQLHQFAQRTSEEKSVWVEPFQQGVERLEADRALLDAIVKTELTHTGHETLSEHVKNAYRKLEQDTRRLRMVKGDPNKKIDAAVALSMAHFRATQLNLY